MNWHGRQSLHLICGGGGGAVCNGGMSGAYVCDFGGTRIKVGLFDEQRGELLASEVLEAKPAGGLKGQLGDVAAALRKLRQQHVPDLAFERIAMALPTIVDSVKGRAMSTISDKYADAPRLDLPKWAKEEFGARLVLYNDGNAAAFGEWRGGAARGCKSCVVIMLGTGIGTGAIIDGRLLRGEHFQAGSMGGHVVVAAINGRRCVCGNVGCAEAEASTWALPGLASQNPAYAHSRLREEKVVDYEAVFRLAGAGDGLAIELRERSVAVWSGLAVTLVHAYDPEMVVLGGGVMRGGAFLVERIQRHIDAHAWLGWGRVRVVPAILGDGAALVGMGFLAADA